MSRSIRATRPVAILAVAIAGVVSIGAGGTSPDMTPKGTVAPFMVAQTATPCRGGYRLIQLVQSRGEPAHGVLVRCVG
jgi:hypothetical protein